MPYSKVSELPEPVKNVLPQHAQDIYKEAFNSAYEEYQDPKKRRNKHDDPEQIAHQVAWAAVKKEYEKGDDDRWHKKKG